MEYGKDKSNEQSQKGDFQNLINITQMISLVTD